MRPIFTILLLIIRLAAWGQDIYGDEKFINSIFSQISPLLTREFHLSNKRTAMLFDHNDHKRIEKELNGIVPDTILNELWHNASIDTINEKWNCSIIKNSICISSDSIRQSFNRDILIFINPKWKSGKKARQTRKQSKAELERISNIPGVHYFSRAVYSKSKEYVMFNYRYLCGLTCGNGCTYLFKKVDGKWIKIGQVNCYIS